MKCVDELSFIWRWVRPKKVLEDDGDLLEAQMNRDVVTVWQQRGDSTWEQVYKGTIDHYNGQSVKVRNENQEAAYYFRELCLVTIEEK